MSDDSFDSLFRACHEDLLRFFKRRLASSDVAADLTQETFARLLRAGPQTPLNNPKAYLFQTARNLVADHYRSAANRYTHTLSDAQWLTIHDGTPTPEAVTLSREELDVIRRAIDELPPRRREVFVMHKFDELSYSEIAAQLGIAKNTVVVHMVRALAHCKKRLDQYRNNRPNVE